MSEPNFVGMLSDLIEAALALGKSSSVADRREVEERRMRLLTAIAEERTHLETRYLDARTEAERRAQVDARRLHAEAAVLRDALDRIDLRGVDDVTRRAVQVALSGDAGKLVDEVMVRVRSYVKAPDSIMLEHIRELIERIDR